MFKMKMLVGLAVLMAIMIVTAAPASAEFKSAGLNANGPIKTFPAVSSFQSTQGGPTIECKSTNGAGEKVAAGEWQIQVKTQKQQGKFFVQEPMLEGPHELLKITKWGVCTGPTGFPATVQCTLQVEIGGQNGNPASAVNGTGSVYQPGCTVKVGNTETNKCEVQVSPGANKELQGVTIENGAANTVEITSNVATISSVVQGPLCTTLGLSSGQRVGHFKTNNQALVTEGQKLV